MTPIAIWDWSKHSLGENIEYLFYKQPLLSIQDTQLTLSHVVSATIPIIVAFFLSKWAQILLKERILKKFKLDPGMQYAILKFTHYIILSIAFYMCLSILNVPMGAFGALITILGVGIGFGLQNLTSNFISGIILLFERPVKVGDRITVDDIWGDVVKINLRTTIVNTPDNFTIVLPNSKLLESNLINWSYGDLKIRLRLPVGVAYGTDADHVTDLLKEVAKKCEYVLSNREIDVWLTEFGDSSINFELVCWLPNAAIRPNAINALNRAVDKTFKEHNIEIPFPQRDLHIKSKESL